MKFVATCAENLASLDPVSRWAQSVNWGAWEAVGTVGAVMLALFAAGRAAREARGRDVAILVAASSVANGLADIVGGSIERAKKTGVEREVKLMVTLKTLSMPIVALDAVEFSRLPDRKAVDQYLIVRSQVHVIEQSAIATHMGHITSESFLRQALEAEKLIRHAGEVLGLQAHRIAHPIQWLLVRTLDRIDREGNLIGIWERGLRS